jgi:hypothetical protein
VRRRGGASIDGGRSDEIHATFDSSPRSIEWARDGDRATRRDATRAGGASRGAPHGVGHVRGRSQRRDA